jgi:hypothetical protein
VDLVSLALVVIVVVAVAAIVYWFVNKSGVAVPQPVKIALYAVLAIVCVLVVANLAGLGPPLVRVR